MMRKLTLFIYENYLPELRRRLNKKAFRMYLLLYLLI